MSKIIVIDPGHGGRDSGAVGNNLLEKDLTLELSRKLKNYIESVSDVKAMMTRDKDIFVPLSGRASYANREGADAFISIHINSATNSSATGYETFNYPGSTKGREFAQAVHPKVSKYWKADRGIKTANFAVLRLTKSPAILLELGFIKNKSDMEILRKNIDNISKDIGDGILDYLGVKKMTNTKNSVKVKEVSEWAKNDWQNAIKLGITDGTRPRDGVTREEAIAMILRAVRLGCNCNK